MVSFARAILWTFYSISRTFFFLLPNIVPCKHHNMVLVNIPPYRRRDGVRLRTREIAEVYGLLSGWHRFRAAMGSSWVASREFACPGGDRSGRYLLLPRTSIVYALPKGTERRKEVKYHAAKRAQPYIDRSLRAVLNSSFFFSSTKNLVAQQIPWLCV